MRATCATPALQRLYPRSQRKMVTHALLSALHQQRCEYPAEPIQKENHEEPAEKVFYPCYGFSPSLFLLQLPDHRPFYHTSFHTPPSPALQTFPYIDFSSLYFATFRSEML